MYPLQKLAIGFLSAAMLTSAAVLKSCSVGHSDNGNTFQITINEVAQASQSTICGHSDAAIKSSAKSFSTNVVSDDCGTTGDTMTMTIKFDKQSPQIQLQALQNGITAGFGTAGVSFNPSLCNLSGIPV